MNTNLLLQISVSGLIAILGILTTAVFSYRKHSFDEEKVFEGIIKDKFEKVYTPLKTIILKYIDAETVNVKLEVKNTLFHPFYCVKNCHDCSDVLYRNTRK